MGAPENDVLEQEEELMAVHNITLTATKVTGQNEIAVTGRGGRSLGKGSGKHTFKFKIIDTTGKNVRFHSLRAADDCSTCPPKAGQPNTQIVLGPIDNDPSHGPRTAEFDNKNDNKPEMDVSYEWRFTCDDPAIKVLPFDPIISNGGRV